MRIYRDIFEQIISPENLFSAWDEFRKGKQNKPDVLRFEWNLEQNIFQLHRELENKTYRHDSYKSFYIHDPKQRHIHKASVRDRVLHHAIFSVISPIFEETFIPTSFSCRVGYGTHKGVDALRKMARETSKNGMCPCFILKCDVRKFFDSVNHEILLSILKKRIKDDDAMWLLESVVRSYESVPGKGIPIGNLTSQIFANIYMNEFDRFMKHRLRVGHYIRYTDDFSLVSQNCEALKKLLPLISAFLENELTLLLHPNKIIVRKLCQGVDFLGYVIFLKYLRLRTKTKRRMFAKMQRRISEYQSGHIGRPVLEQSLQSYLGVLSHANAYALGEDLKNQLIFRGRI
ncbi:MAG: reverse transcriptase domain-containing protein [Candidatus Jorgensenbacteria bacterium]